MRLLFLGDVVGRTGRQAVLGQLPALRTRYRLDFVIVNGENSAGGFGITESIFLELLDAGADVVTLGNHAFDQKEALVFIERQPRLIRPINYPPGTPGKGSGIFKAANGADVLVINAMGLIFMPELSIRSVPSTRSSTPAASSAAPTPFSSISMPRPPARSRRWDISSTGGPAAWSAPTRMRRPPTSGCCPAARPT